MTKHPQSDAPNPSGNRPATQAEIDIGLEPEPVKPDRMCERCGGVMLPVRAGGIRHWSCTGRGCKIVVREAV